MKKNEHLNRKNEPLLKNAAKEIHMILDECSDCPEKLGCGIYHHLSAAELYLHQYQMEDDADIGEKDGEDSMKKLNKSVSELVDSLFDVEDKVEEVRGYLQKLDDLTDVALDYLSAIGVPQLSQED